MDTDTDTDFTFPATSTTVTTAEPAAVVVVAGALPAAACRPLRLPRFAAASSSSPPRCSSRFPPSPPPPAAPVARSRALALTAMAEEEAQQGPPGAGGDAAAAAAAVAVAEVEDRMDLLWEDFNEELARGGGSSCRCRGVQARGPWSESDSSDAESSEPPAARGCVPVLRPSSRAAAVGHCRRRAGTWVLLMRIFRRLFVIEKTAITARRYHAAATTRAS